MRMMVRAHFGTAAGNKAIKDGSIGRVLEEVMSQLKPESAYFFADGGQRTAQIVFQMKDTTEIPNIAERFFQELDAGVEMCPVMTFDDLRAGLAKLR